MTWEKNTNHQRQRAFEEQRFTHDLRLNSTDYRLFEEAEAAPAHCFDLRRGLAWNLRTNHRTSVLCWDGGLAPRQSHQVLLIFDMPNVLSVATRRNNSQGRFAALYSVA